MTKIVKTQLIPLSLTVVTFLGLCTILYIYINFLNLFPAKEKIIPKLQIQDVLVGFTIYIKTAIDFAILIGNLMSSNQGWKKRIAIELGTALGNGLGTLLILAIWYFFKEVPILMVIMIVIASLILLRMAEESFEGFLTEHKDFKHFHVSISFLKQQLTIINRITKPTIGILIPNASITNAKTMSFFSLIAFSITVPFILGLDDFAGYIPLFTIINVFGFAVGVFLGHMLLNLGLFLFPRKTVDIVKHPLVHIFGGGFFLIIAIWGIYEAIQITMTILR